MRKNNRIYINVEDLEDIPEPENEKIDFNFPEEILSNRQKEVVRMIFWGDLKAVEVAEQLGITSRTVRCIKHQAIQKTSPPLFSGHQEEGRIMTTAISSYTSTDTTTTTPLRPPVTILLWIRWTS